MTKEMSLYFIDMRKSCFAWTEKYNQFPNQQQRQIFVESVYIHPGREFFRNREYAAVSWQ